MTTYVTEILYADNDNRWVGKDGMRFATQEEAQACIEDLKRRMAERGRVVLDTRIVENDHKATHVWSFELNRPLSRGYPK